MLFLLNATKAVTSVEGRAIAEVRSRLGHEHMFVVVNKMDQVQGCLRALARWRAARAGGLGHRRAGGALRSVAATTLLRLARRPASRRHLLATITPHSLSPLAALPSHPTPKKTPNTKIPKRSKPAQVAPSELEATKRCAHTPRCHHPFLSRRHAARTRGARRRQGAALETSPLPYPHRALSPTLRFAPRPLCSWVHETCAEMLPEAASAEDTVLKGTPNRDLFVHFVSAADSLRAAQAGEEPPKAFKVSATAARGLRFGWWR